MNLADYVAVLRKHFFLILLTTVIVVGLAAAGSFMLPRQYEAQSQLFVSTQGQDSNSLLQGSSFSQQRVKSYAEAMTSPLVLTPIIEELRLDVGADELAESMEANVPLDTVLIELTVTDEDPQRAADIANAVSERFSQVVPTLENTSVQDSPVQVTVLREALPAQAPSSPDVPIILAVASLLGLLLGTALAVLRFVTDTVIRGESDLKSTTDGVIIGSIPFAKESSVDPLVFQSHPHSSRAETFRTLRTNLQFVDAAHPARSMVFTSSVPGEGKTTTTANLALAKGESGARVCVVEADLRRPRLVHYLGLVEGAGLSNLILGDVDLEDVLQPLERSNVSVIGAGSIPPNPSELLGSPAMSDIVTMLEEKFDYVIYDAPPLLPVTDAAVLGKRTGGVVVVVGAGVVRKEQLAKTLELLGNVGADVLGLVLNRVAGKGADSYSYYRDGYAPDVIVPDPAATRSSHRLRRQALRR